MTTALILGAGGFIGTAVATAFARSGAAVIGAARGQRDAGKEGCEFVQLDRSDSAAVVTLIRDRKVDVVVDMAAYTLSGTQPLLESLGPLGLRYLLLSSADVYRNYGLLLRREAGTPDEGALTETAPLRSTRFPYKGACPRAGDDPQAWMDFYDKIPVEDAVRQLMGDWTILRLPMVFGPGDPQRRFAWVALPMLRGEDIEAPSPWLDWITTYDHVENVGEAARCAAMHPEAKRKTFNLASWPPISHREWVDTFREYTGWSGKLCSSASSDNPLARSTAALDLTVPLVISGEAIRRDLEFVAPVSTSKAIASTLEAFRAR